MKNAYLFILVLFAVLTVPLFAIPSEGNTDEKRLATSIIISKEEVRTAYDRPQILGILPPKPIPTWLPQYMDDRLTERKRRCNNKPKGIRNIKTNLPRMPPKNVNKYR